MKDAFRISDTFWSLVDFQSEELSPTPPSVDGLRHRGNGIALGGSKPLNITSELDQCQLWQHTHSHTVTVPISNGHIPGPLVTESSL